MAFKLAQGIASRASLSKECLIEILDLVAIGTIGDIVPLIDENRTLVKYGIKRIKAAKRKGLEKLIKVNELKSKDITSENIAYIIVPHINSSGRISNPKTAISLLNSKDSETIDSSVISLLAFNKERKRLQEKVYKECIEIIEREKVYSDFLVVFPNDAHEGITGIVAGKLKDKYERPTIVLTKTGEFLKGTGRSIKTVDMYKTLKGADYLFEKFGGHQGACGFLMREEKLDQLVEYLENEMKELTSLNSEIFMLEKETDYLILGNEIDFELLQKIESLSPFGFCNERPYFEIKCTNMESAKLLGDKGQHMKFNCFSEDLSSIECILFGDATSYIKILDNNCEFNIFGYPSINSWKGNMKIQFVVDKIKC